MQCKNLFYKQDQLEFYGVTYKPYWMYVFSKTALIYLKCYQKHTAFVAQKRGIAIAIPPQSNLAYVERTIVTAIKDPR